MKQAVIIVSQGFEDSEFIYPYYRLQEEGFKVDISSKNKGELLGKNGFPIKVEIEAKDLNEKNYDLVVIPGGYESPDRVRQIEEVLRFIREMNDKGKIISSVCHGPWVLISAGIMKGKKATCYKGCKDDLINCGANYLDEDVVVDGNIITSPHFRNLAEWMKETITQYNNYNK
ncbi:type 1 glutamine amidotransferase [Candidatus Pacearchaeota archaeon]|nr:type 1 glutamine amidotransferase [Candidatus Pacearchaeota archaeon]